jgi:hypothetical protein
VRRARRLYEPRRAVADALATALRPASPTPLNVDIGPHRRFDWCETDLEVRQAIKSRLGGTVNDVVLAIATGALRRFLHRRGPRRTRSSTSAP